MLWKNCWSFRKRCETITISFWELIIPLPFTYNYTYNKISCNIIKFILYTSMIKKVIILKYLLKLKYFSSNPNIKSPQIPPPKKISVSAHDCNVDQIQLYNLLSLIIWKLFCKNIIFLYRFSIKLFLFEF